MKKINNALILIVGVLLFIIAYGFDLETSLFFKNLKFPVIDFILGIITNFGIVILVTLILPSLILFRKNKRLAYTAWVTFVISFSLAFLIKLIALRQRPSGSFTYPFTNIINYSFPSTHAMVVFSLLPILTKYFAKQKIFWVVFAFLIAFSRVYLGFHFLSDVIFGALVGYFTGNFLLELHEKGRIWKNLS